MSASDKLDDTSYDVFCGLDVGKSEHHACALAPVGTKVHDKPLPNDEPALAAVFTALQSRGRVLVIVDQPASIGALAIAVARSLSIDVAYLPRHVRAAWQSEHQVLARIGAGPHVPQP